MSLLEIIVLAIVQGITEFLPISSDGHLVLANELLQLFGRPEAPNQTEVTIVLHLGTLAAVLVFYRREILRVLTAERRAILPIIVGTIPAAIIGLGIKKGLPDDVQTWLLESPLLAGVGFLITATALYLATRSRLGSQTYPQVAPGQALLIGTLQAAAILPGVSRSGLTIAGGLATGLERENAAAYSFLLAIPAIAGAGLLEILDALDRGHTSTPLATLGVGFAVSMVVGLAALALLIRWLKSGRLSWFIYYLLPLGLGTIAWQLLRL